MPKLVTMGAMMQCSFGAAPASLIITPEKKALCSTPVATIMDFVPMKNIPPFGMCSAPTNPQVIAATAAKLGVFTPVPCVPATAAPWVPGSATVMLGGVPALNDASKCMCTWLGVISVTFPGQVTTDTA